MATYLREISDEGPDKLTLKERKELADLRKELKKFKEMDLTSKANDESGSED